MKKKPQMKTTAQLVLERNKLDQLLNSPKNSTVPNKKKSINKKECRGKNYE